MKKKFALLMAAIMTVAMVPMTAFAATDLSVAKHLSVGVGDSYVFDALVELENSNKDYGTNSPFTFKVELENGKFAKADAIQRDSSHPNELTDDDYIMNDWRYIENKSFMVDTDGDGTADTDFGNGYGDLWSGSDTTDLDITHINVKSDTVAEITVNRFKPSDVISLPLKVYANDEGEVKATLYSNKDVQFDETGVIATAYVGDATVESDGVVTFVQDSKDDVKKMKPITITGKYNEAISLKDRELKLKLKGDFRFVTIDQNGHTYFSDGTNKINTGDVISFLNDDGIKVEAVSPSRTRISDDEVIFTFENDVAAGQIAEIYINGIYLTPTSKCDPGDDARLTISSKDIESVTLDVAKMVEEAVTYTVEDDELPVIWAGKDYAESDEDNNTLEVSVEENTGDILNTSRKATFTFPDGIEVVALDYTAKEFEPEFSYKIDENVVTIWDYAKNKQANAESEKPTDFGVNFLLNAAPTFE